MAKYLKVRELVEWGGGDKDDVLCDTYINTDNITSLRLILQVPEYCEIHLGGNRYVTVKEGAEELVERLEKNG